MIAMSRQDVSTPAALIGRTPLVRLRAFEPRPGVEIYAKLVKSADGAVVAARSFTQTESPATEDVGNVANAFGAALGRASDDIVGWTLSSGNANR